MIGYGDGVNVRSQEGSGRLPAPKSGAKPKGRNLTPPEVTGEGAFVSGRRFWQWEVVAQLFEFVLYRKYASK